MAKLTWMAHSNPWFCSQKVTEKNNPRRNNGSGWAPCYIFQVSDKYSKGFIFSVLHLILVTASETAGEKQSPCVCKGKSKGSSALCFSWCYVGSVLLTCCQGCEGKKYIQKVPFSWGELIEIHVFSSGLHSNAYKETVNISIKWSHSEPYENRWGIAVATKNWYSNYQPCIHRLQHCWLQYRIGCQMPSSPPLFE